MLLGNPFCDIRLHKFALVVVSLGALTGIVASFVAWNLRGQFATTTFVMSLIALVATWPVFRDYRNGLRK